MKLRAAKKDFKRNEKVLRVGYCGLQYLLRYADPFAYSRRCTVGHVIIIILMAYIYQRATVQLVKV